MGLILFYWATGKLAYDENGEIENGSDLFELMGRDDDSELMWRYREAYGKKFHI